MSDVFISYKSERRPAARHLAKIFEAYGYSVCYDYGLVPGEDIAPRLSAEVADAKAVVVLWCAMSVTSEWVQREARESKLLGKYLPCWIQDAKLPDEFADADTINLSNWNGSPRSYVLDRLVGDLARRIGRNPITEFNRLRELEEDWRGFGAPTLAQFALGSSLTPERRIEKITSLEIALESISSPKVDPDCILNGPPPDGIYSRARLEWEKAQNGDIEALLSIAFSYADSINGFPLSDENAVQLYKIAAERGSPKGQFHLAWYYRDGEGGLEQNFEEAVRLFSMAAEQDDHDALFRLGEMYDYGSCGMPQSDEQATNYYNLAADMGNMGAQYHLSMRLAADGKLLNQD